MKSVTPVPQKMIFEARFDRGYRYLDVCGRLMLELETALSLDRHPIWMPREATPTGASLICPECEMSVAFNASKLVVEQDYPCPVEADFIATCQTAYGMVSARLDVRSLVRVGARRQRMIPADDIESADRLSVRYVASPLANLPPPLQEMGLGRRQDEFSTRYETEDRSRGVIFRVGPFYSPGVEEKLDDRLRTLPHLLPKGQNEALRSQLQFRRRTRQSPIAGLMLDVDYYWTWPAEALFSTRDFLRESTIVADGLEEKFLNNGRV